MATLFSPRSLATNGGHDRVHQLTDSVLLFNWEDAIDMYNGFEYQESAHSFIKLATAIPDEVKKVQCQLNAALVHSRTGAYQEAANVLDDIATEGNLLAFTLFLMGHVQFELSNPARAAECFRISLNHLEGETVRFEDLDFELHRSNIEQNLTALYQTSSSILENGSRKSLPADGISKPPSRSGPETAIPLVPVTTATSTQSAVSSNAVDSQSVYSTSPVVTPQEQDAAPAIPQMSRRRIESVEYSSGDVKYHNLAQVKTANEPSESRSTPSFRSFSTMVRRISSRRQEKAAKSEPVEVPPIPDSRTRTLHSARDTKPQSSGVRDLTNLVLRVPRQAPTAQAETLSPTTAETIESPSNESVPETVPGLSDRDSISVGSSRSSNGSRASSVQSVDVTIHTGSEPIDTAFAAPLPPKNPTRRVVAMERAQKLLAERNQGSASKPRPIDLASQHSEEYARAAGLPSPTYKSSLPAITVEDTGANYMYDVRVAPLQVPRKSPHRQSQDMAHSMPPQDDKYYLESPRPAPQVPAPKIPQRMRPDTLYRSQSMSKKFLPSLPEQQESHHRSKSKGQVESMSYEEAVAEMVPMTRIHLYARRR